MFLNESDIKSINSGEYQRIHVSYENKSQKYVSQNRDFSKQFAHIYASRLCRMKLLLPPKIQEKWGDKFPVKMLYELDEENPQKCIIIGTFFKNQQLKPSVLKDLSEENQLAPQQIKTNFVDESDVLILEDELQRIRLLGGIDAHSVVTGVVCAVLGYEACDGKFTVEDILYFEGGPQKSIPSLNKTPLLVIMSGLSWDHESDFLTSLELLQQWIFGNLESADDKVEHDWEAASIVRVIIAGNAIKSSEKPKNVLMSSIETITDHNETIDALNKLDMFIKDLARSVHVDLMPGEFDPTNYMLPQQPLHPCMFPECGVLKSFQGVTNPYNFELDGINILGSSGQNVIDVKRYSKVEKSIDALSATLEWSHIFPTAPDTLPCHPYYNEDPFIIEECPHIYFAGNCDEFDTKIVSGKTGQKTRLVCVPKFYETQTVAVVNLRTLDTHKMSFKVRVFDDMDE